MREMLVAGLVFCLTAACGNSQEQALRIHRSLAFVLGCSTDSQCPTDQRCLFPEAGCDSKGQCFVSSTMIPSQDPGGPRCGCDGNGVEMFLKPASLQTNPDGSMGPIPLYGARPFTGLGPMCPSRAAPNQGPP
jgi:hypothetical protein